MAQAQSGPSTREVLLCDAVHDVPFYRRGVLALSLSMLGVFFGFQAAQGLQTSLNATLGYINLASLYGAFCLGCLVAPPALARLDAIIGLRGVMFFSSLAYVAMIFSNMYVEHWALPISMNVLVGISAPLLWTCQNDYIGRCAFHASECPVVRSEYAPDTSLETMTATFNSLFFSIYQFSGMSGNVLASVLMLAFAGNKWMKDVLFIVLGGVSIAGTACFVFMPRVGPADERAEMASLKATAVLAFGDRRMTFFIPLIFTNGMLIAFVLGDFPRDIVCPVAGESFTGFVVAAFFGVNACATALWGRLISKSMISRRTAFVAAGFCQLACLVGKILWPVPGNYVQHGTSWDKVSSPSWSSMVIVFVLISLFAAGDAFWESGPPAALQNFFLGTPHVVPAMANYKMWQSLGFCAQFVIGAEMGSFPLARVLILSVLCLVSIASVLVLDRVASIQ
eukprot:CAMPEP_0168383388 /NCGR_PEP_ID=MMETSP0228-20121227/13876_1 /TAXON_ID=133427 /ORGANISM="Protoceratium reticulatum, Strain CCCM 535 (=CCMP 1889)" /LENGTH=451 /DNA_ID=CAMNT_0008396535 /DNA_START=45 /DNA_END=1400 /DNA_ORIENTATION=-